MFDTFVKGLGMLLTVLPYAVLCFIPFWGNLKISTQKLIFIFALFLSVQIGTTYLYISLLSDHSDLWQLFVYVLLAFSFMIFRLTVRMKFCKLFYVFLMVATYAYCVTGFSNYVEVKLYPSTFEILFSTPCVVLNALLLVITMPFFAHFLHKFVRPAILAVDISAWKFMWLIPATFLGVLSIYMGTFEASILSSWQYITVLSILTFGTFLVYYVVIKMITATVNSAKLEVSVTMMQQQLTLQGEQYKMLTENIALARAARHDVRHHLSVLESYIDSGKNEELRTYLSEYKSGVEFENETIYCQNFSVNAVIRHYIGLACKNGIDVSANLEVPENTGIADTDLCIIFGNLLENAIEACARMREGTRFIRLNSIVMANMLAITIDNSFNGEIKKDGEIFLSHKRKGAGIGLSSVSAVAKKYEGTVKFEYKDQIFEASVMLKTIG